MAFIKPTFYPILPRVKRGKTVRNTASITNSTTAIRFQEVHIADRRIKSLNSYTPLYININRSVNLGNCTRSGSKLPDWKQVVAKGGNATNAYSRSITTFKGAAYTCHSQDASNNDTSDGYGQMYGDSHLLENDWISLEDQALGRLKNRLNGHIGKAQLAAPLAESREIHRLVRQINGITLDTLKALLAIKKTKGRSAFKQFGNIWLGFGFGVNPMLKDIESAANSILDFTTREDHQVRISGTANREYMTSRTITGADDIARGMIMNSKSSTYHLQSARIVAGLDLKLRSSASYSVTDHLGLEVGALPGVLWELTPFSWVADYFFTVGPWLDDMFYTLPGTTKYVSLNRKYQSETTSYPYPVLNAGLTGWLNGPPAVSRHVFFSRATSALLPSRALRIKTTDEIANNGLSKLLNLGSVLAQKWGPRL